MGPVRRPLRFVEIPRGRIPSSSIWQFTAIAHEFVVPGHSNDRVVKCCGARLNIMRGMFYAQWTQRQCFRVAWCQPGGSSTSTYLDEFKLVLLCL